MMKATISNEDFTGVIALNNYGIILMQRQCYKTAQTVFRDALVAIQYVQTNIPIAGFSNTCKDGCFDPINIPAMVERGARLLRMANPGNSVPYDVVIVSDDEDPRWLLDDSKNFAIIDTIALLGLNGLQRSTIFASEAICELVFIVSASIMHNLAMTYVLSSFEPEYTNEAAVVLLNCAYVLYTSSGHILWSLMERSNPEVLQEILIFLLVLLRNLCQVTFYLGMHEHNSIVHLKVRSVRKIVFRLKELGFFDNSSYAASSA
jgi:hypothetical protein